MNWLGGVVLTAVSLAGGWIALWPLRHRLGPVGYHGAAYPVGLLVWPMATSLSALLHAGYQAMPVYLVLVALLFAVARTVARLCGSQGGITVRPVSYAVWGVVVVGLSAVVAGTGITSAAYDSVFHYERWGTWLFQTGKLHREFFGAFGEFLPSVHAANRYFGADWTSTPYPVLSFHVVALFFSAVYEWSRARMSSVAALAVAGALLVLMVTAPRYIHHTLYVHSHMISAAYLFLTLFALQRAYFGPGKTEPPAEDERLSWLFVAGLACAGFALARSDGLAYAAGPIALATILWLASRSGVRSQAVFLCAAAAPVAIVYAPGFVLLGLWRAGKLSGKKAAAVLAVLGLGSLATVVLGRRLKPDSWLRSPGKAKAAVYAAEAVVVLGLLVVRPEKMMLAASNMALNLLVRGGNGHLWYFAVGAIAVSLLYGGQWRRGPWPGHLLFAVGQFFVIALVVHGVGHVGRLSVADSFNRVSFHAVPLIFWYAALVLAAVAADYSGKREEADA